MMCPGSSPRNAGPETGGLPYPTVKAGFLGKHFSVSSQSRRAFTPRSRSGSGRSGLKLERHSAAELPPNMEAGFPAVL